MSKRDNYTNVLLEEIRDQNMVVIEAVGQIQDQVKTLATKEELSAVAKDVKTIKAVLTHTHSDVRDLDRRVTVLEHVAAS